MEDENWIEFATTIRNVGNRGKSRGINISMLTKKEDIGRRVVGKFRFTDDEPDNSELEKQRKEQIVERRSDKVLEVKSNCFNNIMMKASKESGIRVELLLTQKNLDIYLELLSQFTAIDIITEKMQQQGKPKEEIKQQEQLLKEQIIAKLQATYGTIPKIIISAVEGDVLEGYTQSFVDKLVSFSEQIMTDRTLLWKRKKGKKKQQKK